MVTHEKFIQDEARVRAAFRTLNDVLAEVDWKKWTPEQQLYSQNRCIGISCGYSRDFVGLVVERSTKEWGSVDGWCGSEGYVSLLVAAKDSVAPTSKSQVFIDQATGKRYKVIEEEE